jgi:hypothetical protein
VPSRGLPTNQTAQRLHRSHTISCCLKWDVIIKIFCDIAQYCHVDMHDSQIISLFNYEKKENETKAIFNIFLVCVP